MDVILHTNLISFQIHDVCLNLPDSLTTQETEITHNLVLYAVTNAVKTECNALPFKVKLGAIVTSGGDSHVFALFCNNLLDAMHEQWFKSR